MDTELHSRWLPDGRFELTLGKCVPVIVRPNTFFWEFISGDPEL